MTIGLMYGFKNLIREMDRIARRTEETVIMQIGNTSYEPKYAQYFRFASREEIDGLYKDARIVVSHAGVGSILTALQYNKQVIVIPRKKKDGEVADEHQIEIARELEREGKINVVYDIRELEGALMSLSNDFCVRFESDKMLTKALGEYINGLTE